MSSPIHLLSPKLTKEKMQDEQSKPAVKLSFRSFRHRTSRTGRSHWHRCKISESSTSILVLEMQQQKESRTDAGPGRTRSQTPSGSAWPTFAAKRSFCRLPSHNLKDKGAGMSTFVHESEISTFQCLCLDNYDENDAIEILLDSVDRSLLTTTASSTGGKRWARKKNVAPVDGKRKFLDRLFFTPAGSAESSRRASAALPVSDLTESTKENSLASCHLDSLKGCDVSSTGLTQSTVTKSETKVKNLFQGVSNEHLTAPPKVSPPVSETHRAKSKGEERFDAFSNVSSFSGTRASSRLSPVTFGRHESLGPASVDIRNCLKKMERHMGQAGQIGQKVSRKKVIRALCTVVDSLEDDEERDLMKTELETIMKKERDELSQPVTNTRHQVVRDDEKSEFSISDDEDFTYDDSEFEEDDRTVVEIEGKDASSVDFMGSVGNFLGVNSRNRDPVEAVLDDLLWTEFVSSRKENRDSGTQQPKTIKNIDQPGTPEANEGRKITLEIKHCEMPPKKEYDLKAKQSNRSRSWWRTQDSSLCLGQSQINEVHHDDEEFSDMSSEFPTFFPTRITVYDRDRISALTVNTSLSFSNSRYKLDLVDTESCHGFEMDDTFLDITGRRAQ